MMVTIDRGIVMWVVLDMDMDMDIDRVMDRDRVVM